MKTLGMAMLALSLIVLGCAAQQPQPPAAPEVLQHTPGSLTGTGWTALPDAQRNAYVMGVVDAWFSIKQGLPAEYGALKQCLERYRVSYEQMGSRVGGYVQGHQSDWPKDMGGLTFAALQLACERTGQK